MIMQKQRHPPLLSTFWPRAGGWRESQPIGCSKEVSSRSDEPLSHRTDRYPTGHINSGLVLLTAPVFKELCLFNSVIRTTSASGVDIMLLKVSRNLRRYLLHFKFATSRILQGHNASNTHSPRPSRRSLLRPTHEATYLIAGVFSRIRLKITCETVHPLPATAGLLHLEKREYFT